MGLFNLIHIKILNDSHLVCLIFLQFFRKLFVAHKKSVNVYEKHVSGVIYMLIHAFSNLNN